MMATDNILEFVDDNIGCMKFLMEAAQRPEGEEIITLLRETGLRGSRAYQLWNDCCGRDIDKVAAVAGAYAAGFLTKEKILEHVDLPFGEPFAEEELKDNGIRCISQIIDLNGYWKPNTAEAEIMQTQLINRAVQQCTERIFGVKDIGKQFVVSIEAGSVRDCGKGMVQIKVIRKEIR